MKALMRGFGLALLCVVILGLGGCGADNETEAEKLQKAAGPPPAFPADSQPIPQKVMTSREDYAKQRTEPYKGTKFDPSGKK